MSGRFLLTLVMLLFYLSNCEAEKMEMHTQDTQSSLRQGCPRKEDIHPCECLEIPKGGSEEDGMEIVTFCKTIRNAQVLQNAMKGMQGHSIDFLVLDSCKLPPFPNGLFFNINIKWMEILNSTTIQFQRNFFECANNCW